MALSERTTFPQTAETSLIWALENVAESMTSKAVKRIFFISNCSSNEVVVSMSGGLIRDIDYCSTQYLVPSIHLESWEKNLNYLISNLIDYCYSIYLISLAAHHKLPELYY